LREAQNNTRSLVRLLEEHTVAVIDSIDLSLVSIVRTIELTNDHPALGGNAVVPLLVGLKQGMPYARTLLVLNSQGLPTHSSDPALNAKFNLSDRDYFTAHRHSRTGGLFISKPFVSRVNGEWTVTLSRRISSPDGGFAGVAAISIDLGYFEKFYQSLNVGQGGNVTMLSQSGDVLARWPKGDGVIGRNISTAKIFTEELPRARNGTYRASGAIDQATRILSYRSIPNRPLVVVVGLDEDEALADWGTHAWVNTALALVFLLVALTLTVLIFIELSRYEALADTLRRSESRFRRLVNAAREGVWEVDADGRTTFVNPRMAEMLGYGANEILGRHLSDFADASGAADIAQRMNLCRCGIGEQRDFRFQRHDGSPLWAIVSSAPLFTDDGTFAGALGMITDISERKLAEDRQREAEMRFRTIFEQAGIGMAMVDIDSGKIMQCNAALARMLGYEIGQLIERTVEDISESEDYRKDRENWTSLAQGDGVMFRMEKRYRRKDGSMMWGVLTSTIIRDEAARPLFIIGMLEDVTAARQSQAELRRLAGRLALTMDSITDGFFTLDLDWCFTYVNREGGRLLRYAPADLLGKVFWDVFDETTIPVATREYRRAMQTMRTVSFEEYNHERDMWFEVRAYPSDEGLAVYLHDVSSRKAAEFANSRISAIVDSSDDAIISKSLDGIITTWNAGAERIFGYSAEEMIGQPILRLIPPELRAEETKILSLIRRNQRVEHFDTERIRKDGTRVDVSITVSPIKDGSGAITGASKVARDISARKQTDAALRDYSRRLQQLSRRLMNVEEEGKRQIGRDLHDLTGSNLSALLMNLEFLRRKMAPEDLQEFGQYLNDCDSLLHETMQHLRDVLAELRPPALDELGLPSALHHHVEVLSRRSDVDIRLEYDDDFPRLPSPMDISLFRITQEALNNALKHSHANSIEVSLGHENGLITLEISDNGSGFDPSFRQPDTTSLGMLTMRERAYAIGAHFSITSSQGQGTRVTVEIQLRDLS
jgi:PAS domain S-box-containing protein